MLVKAVVGTDARFGGPRTADPQGVPIAPAPVEHSFDSVPILIDSRGKIGAGVDSSCPQGPTGRYVLPQAAGLARSMHQNGCFVRHRSGRERSARVEPGGQELAVATRWGWRWRARRGGMPPGLGGRRRHEAAGDAGERRSNNSRPSSLSAADTLRQLRRIWLRARRLRRARITAVSLRC